MTDFNISFQNVVDAQGVGIAVTGMLIVFSALVMVTAFIAVLPKSLDWLEHNFSHLLPAEGLAHGVAASESATPVANSSAETNDEVLAAIGFVMHARAQRRVQG